MKTNQELEQEDFEPITQLLDMALQFADWTWNEPAYYMLVAAAHAAYTDRLKWQVINTARFLGTNDYFVEMLSMGGVDKYPRDFLALADSIVREEISGRVFMEEIMRRDSPTQLPPDPPDLQEKVDAYSAQLKARRGPAMDAALAARNQRPRDDA